MMVTAMLSTYAALAPMRTGEAINSHCVRRPTRNTLEASDTKFPIEYFHANGPGSPTRISGNENSDERLKAKPMAKQLKKPMTRVSQSQVGKQRR